MLVNRTWQYTLESILVRSHLNVSHVIIAVHANLAWTDIWVYTLVQNISSVIIVVHTNLPWANICKIRYYMQLKTFEIWLMWLSLFNIWNYQWLKNLVIIWLLESTEILYNQPWKSKCWWKTHMFCMLLL